MKISVIIATRNRADMLKNCLNFLADQIKKPDEVIVIDNNSKDSTKKVVSNFNKKLPIKYIFEPKVGIPIARNTGIKNARYDIIAFIDDDCVVDKGWVKNLLNTINSSNLTVIQEHIKPLLKNKLWSNIIQLFLQDAFNSHNTKSRLRPLFTGNLIISKKIFKRVGCFDETFKSGEDIELGIRLQQKGYKIRYSPDIIVYHNHGPGWISFAKQQFISGKYAYLLKQKYKKDMKYLPKDLQSICFLLGSLFIMPFVHTFKNIKIVGFKSAIKFFPLIFLQKFVRYSGFFVMKIENTLKNKINL